MTLMRTFHYPQEPFRTHGGIPKESHFQVPESEIGIDYSFNYEQRID